MEFAQATSKPSTYTCSATWQYQPILVLTFSWLPWTQALHTPELSLLPLPLSAHLYAWPPAVAHLLAQKLWSSSGWGKPEKSDIQGAPTMTSLKKSECQHENGTLLPSLFLPEYSCSAPGSPYVLHYLVYHSLISYEELNAPSLFKALGAFHVLIGHKLIQ